LVSSNLNLFRYSWVWEKSKATGFLDAKRKPLKAHEDILIFSKHRTKYNPQKVAGVPYNKGYRKEQIKDDIYGQYDQQKIIDYDGLRYPRSVIYFKTSESEGEVIHRTQKPLSLWSYLINTYTNEGDTVHDSCLGSGTTLEACANLKRNCIGFELLPDWEEHYRKRLRLDNTKLDA
jgi:DNA modification methylase